MLHLQFGSKFSTFNYFLDIDSSLEPDILYRTRKSLEEMGLLKKISKGEYIITDVFIEFYLKNVFE